jgi:peptidoglycan/LPS O-acetylase OafA/YrhL
MAHAGHRQHFRALDGLRLVGALMVLTTHAGFDSGDALRGPFAGILSRLDSGVALFFVVSGFLLFRPHVMGHLEGRQRPRSGIYFIRRAARILPVLWVAVVAAYLLVRRPDARLGDYVEVATLTHIYLDAPLLSGLTQFWSLATEVAFYLVLPAVANLLCRGPGTRRWATRTIWVLAGITAVGPVWMAAATALGQGQARLWLPGFVGWFAIGMALAVWHAARTTGVFGRGRLDAFSRSPGTVWAMAAAVFVLASTPLGGPLDLSEPSPGQAATKNVLYTLIGLLTVLPTVSAVGPSPEPRIVGLLSTRAGVWLGQISYGVFAYHVIVLALVGRLESLAPFTGSFGLRWILTVLVTVGIAALSFHALERPIMRGVRRRSGARSASPRLTTTTDTASHTSV